MSDLSVATGVAESLLEEHARRETFLTLKRECGVSGQAYRDVQRIVEVLSANAEGYRGLNRSRVLVRRGIALWAMGEAEEAVQVLEGGAASAERDFFLALACLEAGRARRACELLEALYKKESGATEVALVLARGRAAAGRAEEALSDLDSLAAACEREPEYHFVRGYCLERLDRGEEAIAEYEKALELDPEHAGALFRLGAHYAFVGDKTRALEYYERLRAAQTFYPNALLNLGVLYEDMGKVNKAVECYKAVLECRPGDWRARLYLKDAESTLNMYYDEGVARRASHKWDVLNQPIAEFELSSRARNCLEKLEIHTLGDLVSKTEEELLATKSLGETTLLEIKQLLMEKGLSLGQEVGLSRPPSPRPQPLAVTDTSYVEDILRCPVTELKLTGRALACMEELGIVTIQDLVNRTPEELLAVRNFGKVSLEEVERKLAEHGLSLKSPAEG